MPNSTNDSHMPHDRSNRKVVPRIKKALPQKKNRVLHGKLLGEDSRGLPGQRKGQQEDREVFNHLGLRGEWLGTGLEKWPVTLRWMAKKTTYSREGFGFCLKDSGDQRVSSQKRQGQGCILRTAVTA